MRRLLALLVLSLSLSAGAALAQTTPAYSSEDTPIGELLDNPQTLAVLEKYIPEFVNAERIDEARGMTLQGVQPYAAEMLTDDVLAKIDTELAKIPAAQ